tara:strand:- start:1096 stop:2214 length:1119 start_codon:yes stop_codon:yes gene_type:complete
MNYSRRSLASLYEKVLEENTTEDMFYTGLDGEVKRSSSKQRERRASKAGNDIPSYTLDDDDLNAFKQLDPKDQARVKKFIQGKSHRKIIKSTLTGQPEEIEQAYRILMSSDMSSDDVESVIQDVNTGKAVNIQKLSTVGNYTPLEIFGNESNWNAYQQLMPIGVGKLQQGPGEVAFSMLSRDVDEQTKGDISINGELYELKLNGGRISDKAGPAPEDAKRIIVNYLGDNVMDYFHTQNSLNTTEFVEKFVNRAKQQGIDTDPMVKELYSQILNPEYAEKMVQAFTGDRVDPLGVLKAFKEHSFDYYKSTKTGGDGAWNKLIGINTKHSNGSVAVVETGEQFANTPMQKSNPNIVRTKSGPRENYIEFKPLQG